MYFLFMFKLHRKQPHKTVCTKPLFQAHGLVHVTSMERPIKASRWSSVRGDSFWDHNNNILLLLLLLLLIFLLILPLLKCTKLV